MRPAVGNRCLERTTNSAAMRSTSAADSAVEDMSDLAAAADDADDAGPRSPPASQMVENWPSSAGRPPLLPLPSDNRTDKVPTIRQWARSTRNSTTAKSCRRSEGVRPFQSYSWKSIQYPLGSFLGRMWPRRQATKSAACSPPLPTKPRDHPRRLLPSQTQVLRRGRTSKDADSFQTGPPADRRRSRTTRLSSRRPRTAVNRGGQHRSADGGRQVGQPVEDRTEARMLRGSSKTWNLACMTTAVYRQQTDCSQRLSISTRRNLKCVKKASFKNSFIMRVLYTHSERI